ncbi:MAG TPA: pseudouridine synthase [Chloroflexota bacterium]|nr:pseudouridine synthase [Chloroflexota bacterium]
MTTAGDGERLQKVLAAAGVASRRRAEDLIQAGRVTVNGAVVTQHGTRVRPRDRIEVDGKPVNQTPRHTYIMLNKPLGVLSTARDERGRRTVLDVVQSAARVYPVGRLDVTSEGLILLTNHGELTHRLLHPSHEVPRDYLVWARPPPSPAQLARLREGVEIEGWRTGPAEVARVAGGAVKVTIHEGHKRQIRLMCQAVGLTVDRLVRTRMGPLTLGKLQPGEWRELRPAEVEKLLAAVGLGE